MAAPETPASSERRALFSADSIASALKELPDSQPQHPDGDRVAEQVRAAAEAGDPTLTLEGEELDLGDGTPEDDEQLDAEGAEGEEGEADDGIDSLDALAAAWELPLEDVTQALHFTVGEGEAAKKIPLAEALRAYQERPTPEVLEQEREKISTEWEQKFKQRDEVVETTLGELAKTARVAHEMLQLQNRTPEQWQQLREQDPVAYGDEVRAHEERRAKMQSIIGKLQAEGAKFDAEERARKQEALRREGPKIQAIFPALADPAKRSSELDRISRFLTETIGYKPEELAQLTDHRQYKVIEMAMRAAAVQQKAAPKIAAAKARGVRVPAPASKARPEVPGEAQRKMRDLKGRFQRLRNDGSLKSTAAALEGLGFHN